MLNTVKLINGTEVSWEEFSRWSVKKQRANLVKPNLPSKKEMSKLIKEGRRKAGLYDKSRPQAVVVVQGGFSCPYGLFPSRAMAIKAAASLGLKNAQRKFGDLCKTEPQNYYYLNGRRKSNGKSKARAIKTPFGTFPNVKACAESLGVTCDRIYKRVKGSPSKYFYID
jgi:hypothetical protein